MTIYKSRKNQRKRGASSLETIVVSTLILSLAVGIMLSFNTNIGKGATETNENITDTVNYAINEADYGEINSPDAPSGELGEFEKVTIADSSLETAIKTELAIESDSDILARDMLTLTTLTASGKGIENLSGLNYAINLKTVNLSNNKIKDITALKGLTKLTSLDISKNSIVDYSAIDGLTLTHLVK